MPEMVMQSRRVSRELDSFSGRARLRRFKSKGSAFASLFAGLSMGDISVHSSEHSSDIGSLAAGGQHAQGRQLPRDLEFAM